MMPAHSATSGAALSAAHGFALFPCLPTKAPGCPHGHQRVAVAQGDPWLLQSSGLRRLGGPRRNTPDGDPLRQASA